MILFFSGWGKNKENKFMLQIGKPKAQIKPIGCVISLSFTIRNLILETKNLLNLILLVPKRKMTCTQAEML